MLEPTDKPASSQLRGLNQALTDSLRRCHMLVDDCRARLAANTNELETAANSNELGFADLADDERAEHDGG